MNRLFTAMLLTTLSIGAANADHHEEASGADATFKSLDKDADQRLSKSEAAGDKMLNDHFAAADADSDGYLSKMEVSSHMKEMANASKRKGY